MKDVFSLTFFLSFFVVSINSCFLLPTPPFLLHLLFFSVRSAPLDFSVLSFSLSVSAGYFCFPSRFFILQGTPQIFQKKSRTKKTKQKKFRKLKWAIFFDDVLEFKQQKKTFFFSIFQISPNDCIIDFVRCLVLQFKSIEFLFSFSSLEN